MKPKKTEEDDICDDMPADDAMDAAAAETVEAGDEAGAAEDDVQETPSARRRDRAAVRRAPRLTDEDNESRVDISWRTIIGGDILLGGWFRRQFWMIILVTFFTIIYVSNRYSCQQEMIERNRLTDTLLDRKYRALTRSSELLEMTLRSRVEEELRDSTIQTSTTPLYAIKTDE